MFTRETKLKYFKRLNLYKNSSGTCVVNTDKFEAWSYDWWQFFKRENGYNIFNNANYSNSTTRHQYETKSLLVQLGIPIHITVQSSKGLQADWKTEVFEDIYKDLFLSEYKLTKKGMSAKVKADLNYSIDIFKERLQDLKGLKYKVTLKRQAELKTEVISRYENGLERKRKDSAERRAKRKTMLQEVTSELKSLEPLTTYNVYDDLNNLKGL